MASFGGRLALARLKTAGRVNSRQRSVTCSHLPGWPSRPLPQHAKVVGGDDQVARRIRGPKLLAAPALHAEMAAQFFDPIFNGGAVVVAPPHRQRVKLADRGGTKTAKNGRFEQGCVRRDGSSWIFKKDVFLPVDTSLAMVVHW